MNVNRQVLAFAKTALKQWMKKSWKGDVEPSQVQQNQVDSIDKEATDSGIGHSYWSGTYKPNPKRAYDYGAAKDRTQIDFTQDYRTGGKYWSAGDYRTTRPRPKPTWVGTATNVVRYSTKKASWSKASNYAGPWRARQLAAARRKALPFEDPFLYGTSMATGYKGSSRRKYPMKTRGTPARQTRGVRRKLSFGRQAALRGSQRSSRLSIRSRDSSLRSRAAYRYVSRWLAQREC